MCEVWNSKKVVVLQTGTESGQNPLLYRPNVHMVVSETGKRVERKKMVDQETGEASHKYVTIDFTKTARDFLKFVDSTYISLKINEKRSVNDLD